MKTNKKIIVVSGLSGSGKSTAIKILEDLGFYCVDNLPVTLLPKFVELFQLSDQGLNGVVMGIDIRERDYLKEFPEMFKKLKIETFSELLFLEASTKVLVRRFSETRRKHPLAMGGRLSDGIEEETEALSDIRQLADMIIDTSEMTIHDLKKMLTHMYRSGQNGTGITIALTSFGYKYGLPIDADIILDVRFLPNPYFNEKLKKYDGTSRKIRNFILAFKETTAFLEKVDDLLLYLIPRYVAEGKSYLSIGLGCTGGKHRSVAMVEELKRRLSLHQYHVDTTHRDIMKER